MNGFVPDDGKRKVDKSSIRHKAKDRIKEKLVNDGKPWSNEQIDLLLETFLTGDYERTGYGNRCVETCGRSKDAIGTALRKLAIRYREFSKYVPQNRTDRSGTPFTKPDYALMELATNESGKKNGACTLDWLCLITGRTRSDFIILVTTLTNEGLIPWGSIASVEEQLPKLQTVYKGVFRKLIKSM